MNGGIAMKIREVLELTQTMPLGEIAKNHIGVSKLRATEAMHKAGCYPKKGLRGWYFDGDESVLEQSIHDFVTPKKSTGKPRPKVSTGIDTGISTGGDTGTGTRTSINTGSGTGFNNGIETALVEVVAGLETGTGNGRGSRAGKNTGTDTGKGTGISTSVSTGTGTDILDRLFTGLPTTTDKKEVSFYLTHDVIEVINRAKKGNRSDLVNEALRKVFREKGWM